MTGEASVIAAAQKRDPSATGALRFADMTDEASLPFSYGSAEEYGAKEQSRSDE